MSKVAVHRFFAAALSGLALVAGLTQVVWSMAGDTRSALLDPGFIPRQIGYGLFALAAGSLSSIIIIRTTPKRALSLVAITLSLMGLPLLGYGAGSAMASAGAPA